MANELAKNYEGSTIAAWMQPYPKLGASLMQHLHNTFSAKYPRLWEASFKDEAAIALWAETWARAFEREGITPKDVRAGLERVSALHPDFPPTEGQFIRCCRCQLEPHAAFLEAVEQLRRREDGRDMWSHPAVYWAAQRIGTYDMRHARWPDIERRWTAMLEDALAHGPFDPVPPPTVAALPAPGQVSLSPEETKKRIAEIRERYKLHRAEVAPEPAEAVGIDLSESEGHPLSALAAGVGGLLEAINARKAAAAAKRDGPAGHEPGCLPGDGVAATESQGCAPSASAAVVDDPAPDRVCAASEDSWPDPGGGGCAGGGGEE